MKLYFDAAYIAKCYVSEMDSAAVRELAYSAEGRYSAALSIAEIACVFHRYVREGLLQPNKAGELRDLFLEDLRNNVWSLLAVSEHLLLRIESATRKLPSKVYLRAGDAIHLAAAQDAGFGEIWSNDRHLLRAAQFFGLAGRSV